MSLYLLQSSPNEYRFNILHTTEIALAARSNVKKLLNSTELTQPVKERVKALVEFFWATSFQDRLSASEIINVALNHLRAQKISSIILSKER